MARQQIAAQALGVLADDQATLAEQQLVLNATQSLSSGSWSGDEFAWIFKVAAQTGATGRWLDIWGKILGVPRTTGEEDAAYGQRILIEIAHASCANAGIAWSLDQILGTSGTQVLDAASFLSTVVRANNGQQANNGLQANSQGRFENTACCYVVRLTQEPTLYSVDDVEWIVRRLQAAGTRLVFVQNASGSNAITLSGPAYLTPGTQATITASCTEDNDYDWTWTVDGAAIVTGQGTNTLTILATKAGTVSVSVSHYLEAGSTATGGTTYLSTIRPLIVLGSTQAQPAGTSGLGAYVDSVENVTYKWTITNGVLESGQGTNSVAFSVGAADKDDGAQATLACVVTYYSEDIQVGVSTTVDILPYP
ncbi:MAG TPA: hypothetical protein VN436_13425, partial [Holophaga sp.]|nr:hypothetical protein [Holophaga sp.]